MEIPSIETFIDHLREQFEEENPENIRPDVEFRQLASWSSMQSLMIIASFDWKFGVTLSAEELSQAQSLNDLYRKVCLKMEA